MGERIGVPGAAIMTSEFTSAARLMARVLGADDYGLVVIDHPIASASVEQLRDRAEGAADDCVRLLTQ